MSFSTYPQNTGYGTGVPFFSQQQTPIGLPVISPHSPQSYWNQPFNPTLVLSELQRVTIHQIALQQLAIQLQQQLQQQFQQQMSQQVGWSQQQQLGGLGNLGGGWPNQLFNNIPPQSIGQPQFAGVV